jgi:hypothetical protein
VNPATGEPLRELAEDTPDAIARKVEKARRAQAEWARTPLADRKKVIAAFAGFLDKNKGDLAARLTSEMGKPITQSRNELTALQGRIRFFLDNVEKALADEVVHEKEAWRETITYEPLGLVGNVSAWNYPYFVGSNVFVPALLAGNAVLYKPSEFATLTGLAITEALHAAGVPAAVFAPVIGGGEAGRALVEQPLDAVFFTGSYATGRKIAEAAARQLMKVQLELGGKDPVYVAEDVDATAAPRPPRTAPSTTPARAAARWSASTYTSGSTTRSWRPSSRKCRGSRSAIPWTRRPTSGPSRARCTCACSKTRSRTRRPGAASCAWAGLASTVPASTSRPRFSRTRGPRWPSCATRRSGP